MKEKDIKVLIQTLKLIGVAIGSSAFTVIYFMLFPATILKKLGFSMEHVNVMLTEILLLGILIVMLFCIYSYFERRRKDSE